jgi:hypothetical protein
MILFKKVFLNLNKNISMDFLKKCFQIDFKIKIFYVSLEIKKKFFFFLFQ